MDPSTGASPLRVTVSWAECASKSRARIPGRFRLGYRGGVQASQVPVTVDAPAEPAVLNGKVKVRGSAMAYTGAAINDAQVKYRVVEAGALSSLVALALLVETLPSSPAQEIAHGTARTGADGSFEVEFAAKPDLSVPEKDEPTFSYTVYADVVDGTGETRSGERSVNAGFVALQASLSAEDWQTAGKPVKVTLKTTSLDGEGRIAEGSLKIHRLKQPEQVNRARLGGQVHHPFHGGGSGVDHKPEPDLSNTSSWELGEVVATQGFTTDAEGNKEFSFTLEEGAYRAVLQTEDRFGKEVKGLLPILVLNPDAKRFGIKVPNHSPPLLAGRTGGFPKRPVGDGLSQRPGLRRGHSPQEASPSLLDGCQGYAGKHFSESERGDARGLHRALLPMSVKTGLPDDPAGRVPWTNKDLSVKWGVYFQARACGQGDLDGGDHGFRGQEGGGRNGCRPLRRIPRCVPTSQLAKDFLQPFPAGSFQPVLPL